MRIGFLGAAAGKNIPYWLPNATAAGSLNINTQVPNPEGSWISPSGTEIYVWHAINGRLYQYTCSTPWDLDTATYTRQANNSLASGSSNGCHFSPDGTKYYIMVSIGSFPSNQLRIRQVNLSVAWDISSGSLGGLLDIRPEVVSPSTSTEFGFKADGTVVYVSDNTSSNSIWEYSLTVAWDISTASYDGAFHGAGTQTNNWGAGFTWSDDGLMTFRGTGGGSQMAAMEYSIAFDVTSQTGQSATNIFTVPGGNTVREVKVYDSGNFALAQVEIGSTDYILGFQLT